jgi:hypothetical protein
MDQPRRLQAAEVQQETVIRAAAVEAAGQQHLQVAVDLTTRAWEVEALAQRGLPVAIAQRPATEIRAERAAAAEAPRRLPVVARKTVTAIHVGRAVAVVAQLLERAGVPPLLAE